jgi:aquaporin Z/aquaporin NIP
MFSWVALLVVVTGMGPLTVAAVHGLALFVAIAAFDGHVSPHISGALWCVRRLPHQEGGWGQDTLTLFVYLLAQAVGWILGTLTVWGMVGTRLTGLGTPGLGAGVSEWRGGFVECMGTFALSSVILFCLRKRTEHDMYSAAAAGGVLSLLVAAAGSISGGSFMWYRHFLPATISGTIDSTWWLYLVGPLTGNILACIVAIAYSRQYRYTRLVGLPDEGDL